MAQAPTAALAAGWVLLRMVGADAPAPSVADAALLLSGWLVGVGACAEGRRRAGEGYGPLDALAAPIYWSVTTLAFVHAVFQTLTAPHRWDKTEHRPDRPPETEDAGRLAA